MMTQKLYIANERILQLAEILKEKEQVSSAKEMFDAVKISKQKVTNVRAKGESFTVKQIEIICKKFNVDANWIFGIESENPFRVPRLQGGNNRLLRQQKL